MTQIEVRLLKSHEFSLTLPLIQLLNPHLSEELLRSRLAMMSERGYGCIAAFVGSDVVGCIGFWDLVKYYVGRHLEPDHVIVHPDYRSQGIGQRMHAALEQLARDRGCTALELNVYVSNTAGQEFWKELGYIHLGQHMQKKLS